MANDNTPYKIVPGVTTYGEITLLKAIGIEPPKQPQPQIEPARQFPLAGIVQKYPL